jgi:hypothetical protein
MASGICQGSRNVSLQICGNCCIHHEASAMEVYKARKAKTSTGDGRQVEGEE